METIDLILTLVFKGLVIAIFIPILAAIAFYMWVYLYMEAAHYWRSVRGKK